MDSRGPQGFRRDRRGIALHVIYRETPPAPSRGSRRHPTSGSGEGPNGADRAVRRRQSRYIECASCEREPAS
jgi:hypothetical protein